MKSLVTLLIFAFGVTAMTFAQNPSTIEGEVEEAKEMMEGPIMTLENTVVDYGTIEHKSDPIRKLRFTNTGTEPLIIKSAKGSCGCTVPTPPKDPILPGETDEITIRYDTKRMGRINKRVTIVTNEGGDPHVIRVIGNIKKAESAPSTPEKQPTVIGAPKDGE